MKNNRLYRWGAALLAAVMVLTCIPLGGSYVSAEEPGMQEDVQQEERQEEEGENAAEAAAPDSLPVANAVLPTGEEAGTPSGKAGTNTLSDGADRSQTGSLSDGTDGDQTDSSSVGSDAADGKTPAASSGGIVVEEADGSSGSTDSNGAGGTAPQAEGDPTPAPAPVYVSKITLDKTEMTLQRESTGDLACTFTPENANTDTAVTFASDNEDVATVVKKDDITATVTARKVGTANITATTANGKRAACTVTVTPIPVERVTLDQETLVMSADSTDTSHTATLKVNVFPNTADNLEVKVTSMDSEIVSVGDVGSVVGAAGVYEVPLTARRAGMVDILVKSLSDPRITASCTVVVNPGTVALTGLAAKRGADAANAIALYEGGSIDLGQSVAYEPEDTTQRELKWAVGAGFESYLSVDENGKVAINSLQTGETEKDVTVIATSTENTAKSCTFHIKIKKKNVPVRNIWVTPKTLAMEDAGKNQFKVVTVHIDPTGSSDRTVTAESNDSDIAVVNQGSSADKDATYTATATVDINGRANFTVTAKKAGECRITFSAGTAGVETVCEVTVSEYVWPVDKLLLSESFLDVTELSTAELTATIEPSAAENKNIDWTVSDPDIAVVVDDRGDIVDRTVAGLTTVGTEQKLTSTVKIKALMVGKCTVTATASGGVKRTCTVTVGQTTANAVTGLKITSDEIDGETTTLTMKPGRTYKLKPEIAPNNASNQKVRWSSNSPAVASVETNAADGYSCTVTANRRGTCTITAQASGTSPDCTKTVEVVVKDPYLDVVCPENWSYTPDEQPITAELLKQKMTVAFYPIEHQNPERDKKPLGPEEEQDYTLTIIGEDGKTELTDIAAGMEKPGIKLLVISYTYDGTKYTKTVQVTMKEFAKADLESVTPLTEEESAIWNVENGTSAARLPLPKTVEIVVKGEKSEKTSKVDAEIIWNLAGCGYDPSNTEKQDFTVSGEVQLPGYVSNPKAVDLSVVVEVHVREAASTGREAAMPKFFVVGGEQVENKTTVTVPRGSKIAITCDTEEAEIYYMLDRRPDADRGIPKDNEHRYVNPIVVEAQTTTIYAVAAKHGYLDSECSECTIKLIPADPDEPEDPDDPDEPIPNDVTDEDREQIGGKVPDGLWAAVQVEAGAEDGFAYTGKAIKPAVHVYDRTRLLTEKKDYTITYKNNINAGNAKGSANPPTILVTGRGNYQGRAQVGFTIKPQSIEDESVLMDEYVAVAYTGKEKKPVPSLTWNGKKLSKNRDYTYQEISYTQPGIYEVTVSGTGNYTGVRTLHYEIFKGGVPVSKLTVTKVANQKYTGSEIRPAVTVRYKDTVLVEGNEKGTAGNYWIKYENCTGPGNASVVIVGKRNYKGSKRINFKILPTAKISQAGITLNVPAAGAVYTGEAIKPECTVNYAGTVLKQGTDYKLSYRNNTKAGKATVVITGMGAFTGTAKKTFKILPVDTAKLMVTLETSYPYEKGGSKPKPVVTFGERRLQEGTDYTLSYKNNGAAGNAASVTVKCRGNYKGQIVRYFEVTIQDIANLKVAATDKVYQRKANIYKTKVRVLDLNGKALSAGSDYAKDIAYTYAGGDREGEPVLATDIIPVGTEIRVEVRVANPKNYRGTVYGTYRIVQGDISKAKVSVEPQQYTGRKVKPKKNQIQVTLSGVPLGDKDYEIVGYENNINQGYGKVILRGTGSYGGTKTAKFKIGKKGMLDLIF